VIEIRAFVPADIPALTGLMAEFHRFIEGVDDLARIQYEPDAAQVMVDRMVGDAASRGGFVDVAIDEGLVVGFVAGMVEQPSREALMEGIRSQGGRVTDLFVSERWRGNGIGRRLMEQAERRLVAAGCETLRVEVFAPNMLARRVYASMGYVERDLQLIKPVR